MLDDDDEIPTNFAELETEIEFSCRCDLCDKTFESYGGFARHVSAVFRNGGDPVNGVRTGMHNRDTWGQLRIMCRDVTLAYIKKMEEVIEMIDYVVVESLSGVLVNWYSGCDRRGIQGRGGVRGVYGSRGLKMVNHQTKQSMPSTQIAHGCSSFFLAGG